MTVELEFRPDPREAAAAQATDPQVLFEETLLLVPVRFSVDGHDLLPIRSSATTVWSVDRSGTATPSEPIDLPAWTEQPLIGLMGQLRRAVAAAQRSGRAQVYLAELPDLIVTVREGSRLEVMSPIGKTTVVAPVTEFTDAIADFQEAVRAWLQQQAPQLMAHPSWAEWFPSPRSVG
jgi:hypothetical protein